MCVCVHVYACVWVQRLENSSYMSFLAGLELAHNPYLTSSGITSTRLDAGPFQTWVLGFLTFQFYSGTVTRLQVDC